MKKASRSTLLSHSVKLLTLALIFGCSDTGDRVAFSNKERIEVTAAIEAATWAFHEADTARSAEGVLNLLWPEFSLLGDGKRFDYASVAEGASQFMASVDTFHTVWTDLQIVPISPTSGVSSFIFTDRITMKSGEVVESFGPNTFVWEKRGDEWRVIHTDADHYPIE